MLDHPPSVRVSLPAYPIPHPEPGQPITTRCGTAIVTHTQPIGESSIIWADYGSGIDQPHTAEPQPGDLLTGQTPSGEIATGRLIRLTRSHLYLIQADQGYRLIDPLSAKRTIPPEWIKCIHTQSGWMQTHNGTSLNPRYYAIAPSFRAAENPQNSTIKRRHSPKGKAVGWIEERQGNRNRKRPSISYYYCWQQGDRRGKTYIPVRYLATVRQMVDQRCSVDDILQAIAYQPTPIP